MDHVAIVSADTNAKKVPTDCADKMNCRWMHLQTEPPSDIWVCGNFSCNHRVRAQPATK